MDGGALPGSDNFFYNWRAITPDLTGDCSDMDTRGWKNVSVEFGPDLLEIAVPPGCVKLGMKEVPPLSDPATGFEKAFSSPIASPTLEEIIRKKGRRPGSLSVAIAVSDITRPVPYKGESGILRPLLTRLESSGIKRDHIRLIVATGMHRASTHREKVEMYGEDVVEQFQIADHDCENSDLLTGIGKTKRGTDVFVNADFFSSDLKIATGLVETHFMTGISGGRKSICPGLVDVKTIQKFHGPDFLENPNATNLVLQGNPCHEEALEVAGTVGVDFVVNVNLDKDLRLVRVFAGNMVGAHMEAYKAIRAYAGIPLKNGFDIVLTHGGYVGRDHYQTAKAAVGALPAVKEGGIIIIAAKNRDPLQPVGSTEYRTLIHLLKMQGPDGYLDLLRKPGWRFTKDQWEPEVWAKVIRKVGEKGLVYCALEISENDYCLLPGVCGRNLIDPIDAKQGEVVLDKAREMVQKAVFSAVARYRDRGIDPTMAFICEGPYAVPYVDKPE
jgi:lactate racemase